MSEDKPTYDLTPEDGSASGPSEPTPPEQAKASEGAPQPVGDAAQIPRHLRSRVFPRLARRARAKIDAPGVLDGFDEDADFDDDPEVKAALDAADPRSRRRKAREQDAVLADPSRWWVQPGFPHFRAAAVIAGILAITATVLAGVNAPRSGIWVSLHTLYLVLLHTGTGMLAITLAATMSARRINEPETAAARIAMAASAFYACYALNITLLPGKFEEMLVGAMAYLLVVLLFFRLPRYEIGVMSIAHAGFWIIVEIGGVLARQIQPAAAAVGAGE